MGCKQTADHCFRGCSRAAGSPSQPYETKSKIKRKQHGLDSSFSGRLKQQRRQQHQQQQQQHQNLFVAAGIFSQGKPAPAAAKFSPGDHATLMINNKPSQSNKIPEPASSSRLAVVSAHNPADEAARTRQHLQIPAGCSGISESATRSSVSSDV
jgi:hypothetical protein